MIARLLLTGFFLCLWLPLASLMLDNISLAPPLGEAKLYGPLPWQAESRAIVLDSRRLPAFVVYGRLTGGETTPVSLKTGLFRWSEIETGAEKLFATDQPARPFVTGWDLAHDAGLPLHAGRARLNFLFLLWALLSAVAPVLFYFWLMADPEHAPSPQELWQRDEAFRQKVRDIEADYADRPGALRLHTVLLAFLGYGVLFGSMLLLLAAGLGLGLVGFSLTGSGALGVLAGMVPVLFALKLFRSLLSPRFGDFGVRLSPAQAPALFALLEKIRKKTNGPAWSRVFITEVMNASVSRHTGPLGFFGFGPVTLSLGLPLMQALGPQQLEGVLGHEYGHVAARDNAFAQWVYRIRNSWLELGERLKTERLWRLLRLNLFYQWFLGFFKAYSFTLSRLCEYEADAFAGRVAGKRHIAEALVAMHVYSLRLQRGFWRDIWKQANTSPAPTDAPYSALGGFFHAPVDAKTAKEELRVIENEKTGFSSTHPATAARVRALGLEIAAFTPPEKSAARALLGNLAGELCGAFDSSWREISAGSWRERYVEYQRALKRRDELCHGKPDRLSHRELEELVSAASVLEDDKNVLAAYGELAARDPADIAARIHMLGYRLNAKSDEAALLKLEDALRENPGYLAQVSGYVLRYLRRQGRLEEAEVWQFRLDEWQYQSREADEIYPTDTFTRHQVKPAEVSKIKAYFSRHRAVGRIYLASKQLVHLQGYAMTVVGIRRNPWRLNAARANRELRGLIARSPFRKRFHIFLLGDMPGVERKLRELDDALIYER